MNRNPSSKKGNIDLIPAICKEGLFHLPDWDVYCKDKDGRYLDCNNAALEFLQLEKEDLINKYDAEMPWRDCAIKWRENDLKVITANETLRFHETMIYKNSKYIHLAIKMPIYNGKQIKGTLSLLKLQHQEILNGKSQSSQLTKRQLECIYYLMNGLTLKEIAHQLKISPRTVEHHIEVIKNKLHCQHRSEVIIKAMELPWIKEQFLVNSLKPLSHSQIIVRGSDK